MSLSYLVFTGQQYFSLAAMAGALAVSLIGLALMLLSYYSNRPETGRNKKLLGILAVLAAASLLILAYESYFDLVSTQLPTSTGATLATMVCAVLVFAGGAYVMENKVKGRTLEACAFALMLLIALIVVIYLLQSYSVHAAGWIGTDEMAYDYYAFSLFARGANPYNATMVPVLTQYKIDPTLELNGSCACTYDYPALSFLLPALGAIAGNGYLSAMVFETVALVVLVGLLLYKRSSGNVYALLPIAAWISIIFYLSPAPLSKYIAVSLFLVVAYLYRTRAMLSSAFLGLAASTHQLAWVALPFFYLLSLREHGKRAMLKSVLVTAGVFLLLNGYFIAISPAKTLDNILSLFTTKTQFVGPSVMQFLVAFYPTAYWYSTALMAIAFLTMLLLFYFYTDTLKPLIALAPAAIFFLSWRNIAGYGASFVPLLIAVYYSDVKGKAADALKNRRWAVYAIALACILAVVLAVYAHGVYIRSNALSITQISTALEGNATTGGYVLRGMSVNLTNNQDKAETVYFYLITRDPDRTANVTVVYHALPADSYHNYIFGGTYLPGISSDTKLYIFALSNDYITGKEVDAVNSSSG